MAAPRRSITNAESSFTVDRPNRVVTFILPQPHLSPPRHTVIVIPPGSLWDPSPHWHERYNENFRVLQGTVMLTVDGKTRLLRPEDGVQVIKKYSVHHFMRADMASTGPDLDVDADDDKHREQDVVVEEWTDPDDGLKEVFFRNLFSVLQDSMRVSPWRTTLQIHMTSAHCDSYPVFVSDAPIWQPLTHLVFAFACIIGAWLGLRPWYDEYTPLRLRAVAASANQSVVDKPKRP